MPDRTTIDLSEVRKISMLDIAVLERLQELARTTQGGILEIGSYIGGSTVALASGHGGRRNHAVIDFGGSYTEHDTLPSADIAGDWKANVERFGVSDHVHYFKGWAEDGRVFRPALDQVGHDIGLFFYDADGCCDRAFSTFARYMRPGCALVLDDYFPEAGEHIKGDLVRPWVDRMVKRGCLIDGEFIAPSTWVGRLGNVPADVFTYYFRESAEFPTYAFVTPAPDPAVQRVTVYEDGHPLGPATDRHDVVREIGCGAFSHWMLECGPFVIFSTSDNSNPNTNGRTYELRPATVPHNAGPADS